LLPPYSLIAATSFVAHCHGYAAADASLRDAAIAADADAMPPPLSLARHALICRHSSLLTPLIRATRRMPKCQAPLLSALCRLMPPLITLLICRAFSLLRAC